MEIKEGRRGEEEGEGEGLAPKDGLNPLLPA